MNKEQNKFYTSIAEYYSEIFPFKPMQLNFVKQALGELEKKSILDIGCATGELAGQLSQQGSVVTGIDLNEDLLKQARQKWIDPDIQPVFKTGNMLELESDFNAAQFDAALCFGNTLVHLTETSLLEKMLQGVKKVLKPDGRLMMQILNYDHIIDNHVSELPLIETDKIRFLRNYKIEPGNPVIRFQTNLVIKERNLTVSNETSLLALRSQELINLLNKSGFRDIQLYANFKRDPFGGNHLPLVVNCCS